MSKRYKPLGERPNDIFARMMPGDVARTTEELHRREEEDQDLETLAKQPAFGRWLQRVMCRNGGIFHNALKTEDGQAKGVVFYYIVRDFCRVTSGRELVTKILMDHFRAVNDCKGGIN